MTGLDIAEAIATIGAFVLAGWQYAEARRRVRTESERVLLQRERLRTLAIAAATNVETADYLVQRSKEPAARTAELTSIARIMRGHLSEVVTQLESEERLLAGWRAGRLVDSRRAKPPARAPSAAGPTPRLP